MEVNMSKIQVVVATMGQKDFSIAEKMNLSTDAVFANQTDRTEITYEKHSEMTYTMVSTETKGVGTNRNIGLMYATGDILLISDDDMVYVDDYKNIVVDAFLSRPDADVFVFNIKTVGAKTNRRMNNEIQKVSLLNGMNYGAARIAVKRSSLIKSRIYFSTCFGGGTGYSAGEDSLFVRDMLKAGFKIYTHPEVIATVDQSTSTWFTGYNEKFLYDKGSLFKAAFPRAFNLMCFQDLIRHPYLYKQADLNFLEAFKIMKKGGNGYNALRCFNSEEVLNKNEKTR